MKHDEWNEKDRRETAFSFRARWQVISPFLFLSLFLSLVTASFFYWVFDLSQQRPLFYQVLAGIAGIGLFIGALFALAFSGRFIDPLRQVTDAIQMLAKGNSFQSVRLHEPLFKNIETSFNQMSESLENRLKSLSDDRQKIVAILSCMVEGVIVLDARGRIVLVNDSFEKMFDLIQSNLIGSYYYEQFRHHALNELVEGVIETGAPRCCEIRLDIPNQHDFQVQASVAKPFKKRSVILVFHDITGKKRQEEIQKDFVANISHELRTPISIVKGYLEALLDGGMENPEQAKEFLHILQKNSDRMENIVQDLLHLSRIESGLNPVCPVSFLLREQIEKNIVSFKPLAQKKNQTFVLMVPSDFKIFADPEKLDHVFTNLLDNGIKYTGESGEIVISANRSEDKTIIQFKDNGIGIPKRDLHRVFERFYRVDRTRSRTLGGTGLGLSIVKQIVEAHGGEVSVENNSPKGARFMLIFPKMKNV